MAFLNIGAGDRNRTGDLRVTSALLYQLSYTGNKERNYRALHRTGQRGFICAGNFLRV